MSYNTKSILRDGQQQAIPQYYNTQGDQFEPSTGFGGSLNVRVKETYVRLDSNQVTDSALASGQTATVLNVLTESIIDFLAISEIKDPTSKKMLWTLEIASSDSTYKGQSFTIEDIAINGDRIFSLVKYDHINSVYTLKLEAPVFCPFGFRLKVQNTDVVSNGYSVQYQYRESLG